MNGYHKVRMKQQKEAEHTRQILKQMLYVLRKTEGFSSNRLTRVLWEWSEIYEYVNDSRNDKNEEMIMIDRVLESVMPREVVTAVGREPLKDHRGRVI